MALNLDLNRGLVTTMPSSTLSLMVVTSCGGEHTEGDAMSRWTVHKVDVALAEIDKETFKRR
jgi:hypothetical protein